MKPLEKEKVCLLHKEMWMCLQMMKLLKPVKKEKVCWGSDGELQAWQKVIFRGASQNYTILCGENIKKISRRVF